MIGNAQASCDKELLQKAEITHILVAGKFLDEKFPEDFKYLKLEINDIMSENLFPVIEKGVNFIKEGKVVFVHCAAGVSRSSSMVIAYLMIERGMRFTEAFDFVRKKREVIRPNMGFRAQLEIIDGLLQKKEFDYKKLTDMKAPEVCPFGRR